jgi:hypothetical protein
MRRLLRRLQREGQQTVREYRAMPPRGVKRKAYWLLRYTWGRLGQILEENSG